MPKFVRLASGSYVNLDFAIGLKVVGSGSTWFIEVDFEPGTAANLDKVWTTEAEAEDALRQIFQPINLADY